MTAPDDVEIIQADRNAAHEIMLRYAIDLPYNGHVATQAFARHRIAHTPPADTLAIAKEALEPFELHLNDSTPNHRCITTIAHSAGDYRKVSEALAAIKAGDAK
jgi:hypothetical protein